jgi:E3 ubiquitin-protein ligase RNF216
MVRRRLEPKQCAGIAKSTGLRCRLYLREGMFCKYHRHQEHLVSVEWVEPQLALPPAAIVQEDPLPTQCPCCWDDCTDKVTVHCGVKSHMLCLDCFQEHVRNVMEQGTVDIACGGHPDCRRFYDCATLQQSIPGEMWDSLDQALLCRTLDEWKQDMYTCPQCHKYQEVVGDIEPLRKQKYRFMCRQCNEHICMGCNHAHAEDGVCVVSPDNMRKQMEEIMTQERLRQCPGCQLPFLRSDGCCKMTCTRCRTKSCYACKQVIQDYSHFRQIEEEDGALYCALYMSEEKIEKQSVVRGRMRILQKFGHTPEVVKLMDTIFNPPRRGWRRCIIL